MRHPPQISIRPQRSRVYCAFASVLTIILIALGAHPLWAGGLFDLKNALLMGLLMACGAWLLLDAWHPHAAASSASSMASECHYTCANGLWAQCLPDGTQIPGTLQSHLDLQIYMLVSFTPSLPNKPFFLSTTQWFHLEASQADFKNSPARWLALRRAVFSQAEHGHEELAA
jgi:hypothetical protein